jgi:hypothetical protein
MIDTHTRKPLRVLTDEIAPAYLIVPQEQVAQLRETLDRHAIRYWVDRLVVSIDGEPEVARVHFYRTEDPARIQAVLDEAE